MRYSWFALAVLFLGTALADGQQSPPAMTQPPQQRPPAAQTQARPATPPPAPAAQPPAAPPAALDPQRNPLDAHLVRWENQMKDVQTLVIQCERTEKHNTFGRTDVFVGEAKYMKLPVGAGGKFESLASLYMQMKDRPETFERFTCTGTHLYQWLPQQKEIRVFPLPPSKPGQVSDDNFLSFLFGMKAEEAKRRYDLRLVKEDQHYIYVEILPRAPADKADFQKARLVLTKSNFLPRQLWFQQPSGDEVKWDLPRVQANVQLDRKEFVAPQPPQGWRLVPAEQQPANNPDIPPRVIRPNQ